MIGESVAIWGTRVFFDPYVCGVGVLEDLQRVVIEVDDKRTEYLMNESGEWISDEQAYKMTKPKTMDHLLTGDDQLGGATLTEATSKSNLTEANLDWATLTEANLDGATLTRQIW